ncbi:MAG TPA: hypothetical protein VMV89_03250 [Candidatus Paceibacterota bacterium]|nr:hypothetical protein [Candidatus Paceibacterota bacterium]
MKRSGKIAICLAGALAVNAALRADDAALPGNPYALIVARNVFGLRPLPPPPDPNAQPKEPPVKITPNGVMSIFGQWQVLFKTTVAGKPEKKSYMLAEGEAQDDIEVVKIDDKAGFVTFNNHGMLEKIPLADEPSAGAVVPGTPGVPGFKSVAGIRFPVLPGGTVNNSANGVNALARGGNGAGERSGLNSTASSSVTPANVNTASQTQATLDPDVQQVLIVANHLKAQLDGDPTAQIYPVTAADAEAGVTSNIAPPASPNVSPAP